MVLMVNEQNANIPPIIAKKKFIVIRSGIRWVNEFASEEAAWNAVLAVTFRHYTTSRETKISILSKTYKVREI